MTIETETTFSGPYNANGVTTVFPFSFVALAAEEVVVVARATDGSETVVDPADYGVTLAEPGPGGTVTFAIAPSSGLSIFVVSQPAFTQEIDFEDGAPWLPAPANEANDRAALRDLWLQERALRAPMLPRGETAPPLPSLAALEGKILGIEQGKFAAQPTSAFMDAVVDEVRPLTEAAEAARDDAQDSASTAESASGPTYDSVGDGEAATTPGQTFAVTNGDGTVTIHLRTSGGSTAQRTLATTAALAASSGASLIGFKSSLPDATIRPLSEKVAELISVKDFGATGDGVTDDTAAIQTAIDESASRSLFFPKGVYRCGKLQISKALSIVGELRGLNPVSYANTLSKIKFDFVPTGEDALTIGNGVDPIIGFSMENMAFSGNQTIDGININGALTGSITDTQIVNCYLYNFRTGIAQLYSISTLFSNVRVQTVINGMDNGSQTNACVFDKCSVVSCSGTALKHSNVEGIEYRSCNISNLSSSISPITFFQSNGLFTNCYFENITADNLMLIGASTEAPGLESGVIIDQPLKLGGDIALGNSNAYAEIRGQVRGDARIIGSSIGTSGISGFVGGRNLVHTTDVFVEKFDAGQLPQFVAYNGGVLTYTPRRGYIIVANAAGAGSGVNLASARLTIGELYTLSIAFRLGTGGLTAGPALRNGSQLIGIPADINASYPTVRHFSFLAADTSLRMQFSGEIDLFGYAIQRGNRRCEDINLFTSQSINRSVYVGQADAVPISGQWYRGDMLYNRMPASGGNIGWVCTTSGTPGIWKSFGAIA